MALLTDRTAEGLRLGNVGTVVHIYSSGLRFEVEFTNAKEDTVAVETEVQPVDVGPVRLHYSYLAQTA